MADLPDISLVWTRPLENWTGDQAWFADPKLVLTVPCYQKVALPTQNLEDFTDVIITSPYAAELIGSIQSYKATIGSRPCHTFGTATAKILQSQGFSTHSYPAGSARKLALLLPRDQGRTYIHLGAQVPIFDFRSLSSNEQAKFIHQSLYTTKIGIKADQAQVAGWIEAQRKAKLWVVCFASPSAVRGFLTAFTQLANVVAIVLGPSTAQEASRHPFAQVVTAPQLNLESLAVLGWGHAFG